jgi:DNA polymerase
MTDLTDVVLDFETYYDTDYSLTKLTNIEYVLDPRFEVIGFSLKIGDAPAEWYSGTFDEMRHRLLEVDWGRARLIAHNAMFDAAILEWHFNIPSAAKIFCTMMASRPYVVPYTGSMSLAAVAKYLGVGEKGHEVENHRGQHRADFTVAELISYGNYCCNDSELTAGVKRVLCQWLPVDEQDLLDLTLKKYLRPKFELDLEEIAVAREALNQKHIGILAGIGALGVSEDDVRSRPTFVKLLKARGVDAPKKLSKTTGKETYAFAKDDEEFIALRLHDDPEVRALVEARGVLSSTLEAKRLDRFTKIWDLDLFGEHLLPIPLLYYAAHPGRFGGMELINLQNLPRPDKKDPRKGALRRSMKAPAGHSVVAADFSNIEARIVATLAGQWDLVAAFANGVDIYCQFASRVYGRTITKADITERFVGKMCILGLGYGMGWKKFMNVMSLAGVKMTEQEARRIVDLYRDTYPAIPALWNQLEELVQNCMSPKAMVSWGPFVFVHERIILPNGMPIIYPGIRIDIDPDDGMYGRMIYDSKRKGKKATKGRLWGGVVTENVTQALARIVATKAEIRIARAGMPAAHQAHDELIWVVPTEWVAKVKPAIERAMCEKFVPLPMLPIAVEIHDGPTYGHCK